MNDKLQHSLIAAGITIVAGILGIGFQFPAWWSGALLAIGIFVGREERDDENRRCLQQGYKWWYSFAFWKWSRDGKLDFTFPALTSVAIALIFQYTV